jgi:acyl carrier protein
VADGGKQQALLRSPDGVGVALPPPEHAGAIKGAAPMDLNRYVREFITSNFYVGDTPLADDDSLREAGIVDSAGVMEVVAFIESRFRLSVDDAEILPANLDSIAKIAAFIARKSAPDRGADAPALALVR